MQNLCTQNEHLLNSGYQALSVFLRDNCYHSSICLALVQTFLPEQTQNWPSDIPAWKAELKMPFVFRISTHGRHILFILLPHHPDSKYLRLQVHHGLLKSFWWCPLMVTKNCNSSVGTVIRQDLCWDVLIRCTERNVTIKKSELVQPERIPMCLPQCSILMILLALMSLQ